MTAEPLLWILTTSYIPNYVRPLFSQSVNIFYAIFHTSSIINTDHLGQVLFYLMLKSRRSHEWKGFKPRSRSTKKSTINQLWKDKKRWNREWKEAFKHVQHCESCGVREDGNPNNILTMMHALKQRYIITEEDCKRAAKVCMREHNFHELKGDHQAMADFVDNLIAKRTVTLSVKSST